MEKTDLRKILDSEIAHLLSISENYVRIDVSAHEIEKGLLSQLLRIGLILLQQIIKLKLAELSNYKLRLKTYKSVGNKKRSYLSLFGKLEIERPGYWSKSKGQFYKLDELLSLPTTTNWSYNIQRLVGRNSAELDFRESVGVLNDLLDLGLRGKGSQRNVDRIGPEVEEFYDLNTYQAEKEGACFMCGFDGKGVPKIKAASLQRDNPKERLSRGQKKGVKQAATVSVVASFTSQQRDYKSIVRGLMGQEEQKKEEQGDMDIAKKSSENGWYKNIHRRAFLANQEKAVEYGILELKARMKDSNSKFVVPIDAGIGLEDKVLEYVKKHKLESKFDGIVLDIVHVSEYVWESGTAIYGESSKFRRPWVKEILEALLQGEVQWVIKELTLHRDKTNLTENRTKQLNKTITYFTNHQHKMNYDWFLKKGYPVSSAIVESTCKHLVKDRMEQSGMRWSSQGAQNMMNLRAVKINGDMDEFIKHIIKKDRKVRLIRKAA